MLSSAASIAADPLEQLYQTLADLREQTHGPYYLDDVDGTLDWPDRGVYFFFLPNSELGRMSPADWRLSRIGNVGVSEGSSNTLWNRLRQNRGNV
ncbi:hypothetical protein SAMN05216218_11625 [Halorientalis regularis]|uniref:GIY-YIG domain-containing protein n=1 Tax=Halorientalis regularis TaxID=660518 RepID=A0A1G7RTH2_9EURY|nr:hypothetical protein SAMN05216218_11625 [Halorientalis regularis]